MHIIKEQVTNMSPLVSLIETCRVELRQTQSAGLRLHPEFAMGWELGRY